MSELSGLSDFMRRRSKEVLRLSASLVFDALLFTVWIGVSWTVETISEYFRGLGVHPWVTEAYNWVSSVSTLVLALLFIVQDIYFELLRLVSQRLKEPLPSNVVPGPPIDQPDRGSEDEAFEPR